MVIVRRLEFVFISVFLLVGSLFLTGCDNSQKVSVYDDGICISKGSCGKDNLYLQVVSDKIIRSVSSPDKIKSLEKGIMCSWNNNCTGKLANEFYPSSTEKKEWDMLPKYKLSLKNDTLILKTKSVAAKIKLPEGEVSFYDLKGKLYLKEPVGGGRSFSPVSIDGYNEYSFRQVFDSPSDEAFYGLGQHQSDEFNYKNKNEELYQYNTKVSVPFVVSNKNYGLLWDNYSYSKWGDVRPYSNIDIFKLFDKTGKEGGLSAIYSNVKNNRQKVERIETSIDYENLETIKKFPKDFRLNNSNVSWNGSIEPKETGLYKFKLYYAGYVKIYLDNKLIVPQRWRTAWNPNNYKFSASLVEGKKYKLDIEWLPDGGTSYLGLKVLIPFPEDGKNKISFWSEMGKKMDYYFIAGCNPDDVIKGYRKLTGKAQVMPKWAMGFWQSRERYKTQKQIIGTLKEFRKRKIPVDNIVLDWLYWKQDAWGSHEFDKKRFPDPVRMIKDIHNMDARILISVWPKFYCSTENYRKFDERGWIYKQAVIDSIHDWVGKGYVGSFYDAYSEGARKLFWDLMNEELYSKGIDAWWMDASEPDIQSNSSMEYRKKLMNPTALGSSTEFFNGYGLMNAKGIYEGQRFTNPDSRVFLLTRSGYAGSQRYAAVIWSGDIGTRWEDMKAQISAGLNYSVSGNPYWTMDDGGFCVEKRYEKAKEGSGDKEEWRELNVRWNQFGSFAPVYRSHGQYPYREFWNIAPETHPAYNAMLYYDKLRYKLMPYIYTLAGKCYFDDYTIMRPLMMDYENDTTVLNISDQYMFGPSLMVCPVYKYKARSRIVYFPKGNDWYDIYSGRVYEGGMKETVPAPYNRMPVFAAAGSIIPTGMVIQSTKEKQKDITLYVYAGKDGKFSLYEDEGVNYNYEKGKYTLINFSYNNSDRILSVSAINGFFDGMIKNRTIKVILVDGKNSYGVDKVKRKPLVINYAGTAIKVKL